MPELKQKQVYLDILQLLLQPVQRKGQTTLILTDYGPFRALQYTLWEA